MDYKITENGNFVLLADNEDRAEMAKENREHGWYANESYIHEALFCDTGFSFTLPEDVGALTDSPIISDGTEVWWFPDYMIIDPWKLLRQGRVEFVKGS